MVGQTDTTNINWDINSADGGTVSSFFVGNFNFNGFGNLKGNNTNTNLFLLDNGGSLSGSINGGGSGANTLTIGTNATTNWTITGANAGNVTGVTGGFSNIQNLTGSTGTNTFTFNNGASISGNLNGGGSVPNSLDVSAYTTPVTINLAGGASTIASTISNINTITGTDPGTGSSAISTLDRPSGTNTWALTSKNRATLMVLFLHSTTLAYSKATAQTL